MMEVDYERIVRLFNNDDDRCKEKICGVKK